MPLPAVIHCTSPRGDDAAVAQAVAVLHVAVEHVGDGLDAAMRMPGEARQVVRRVVGAEIVQQQEGVELGSARRSRRPAAGARPRPRWSVGS